MTMIFCNIFFSEIEKGANQQLYIANLVIGVCYLGCN